MGKSTYTAFQTDERMEQTGILLDFGDAGKIKIARAGGANTAFNKKMMALAKPHRHAIQTGLLSGEKAEEMMLDAYATTVVLGWDGITDKEGNVLPFSVDNVKKVFKDLPDLFSQVRKSADDAALFRADELEADVKNS